MTTEYAGNAGNKRKVFLQKRQSFGDMVDAGIPDEEIMKNFCIDREEFERKKKELVRIRKESAEREKNRERRKKERR